MALGLLLGRLPPALELVLPGEATEIVSLPPGPIMVVARLPAVELVLVVGAAELMMLAPSGPSAASPGAALVAWLGASAAVRLLAGTLGLALLAAMAG